MLIDEVVAALGQDLMVKELTAFDAQRTRYDARLMPGSVDYSKGVLEVEFLPPITDEEFDTIVAAVLSVEEQPAEEEQPQ